MLFRQRRECMPLEFERDVQRTLSQALALRRGKLLYGLVDLRYQSSSTVYSSEKPKGEGLIPSALMLVCAGAAVLLFVAGVAWYLGYRHATARENRRSQEAAAGQGIAGQGVEASAGSPAGGAVDQRKEFSSAGTPRGSLVVKTTPPNALVKVGNAPAQRTPAVIPDLKVGTQFVQISLEGYETAVVHSEVQENQPAELDVVLKRSLGALRIESVPSDLRVELKNNADPLNPRLAVTPLTVPKIETGEYEVTVIREGWPIQTKPVTVAAGSERKLLFEFPGGSATINSQPPGAKVVMDGKNMGVTPYPLSDIPAGVYPYSLVLPGYEKYSGKVTIQSGPETVVCVVALARKSAPKTHSHHASSRSSEGDDRFGKGFRWLRFLIPEGFGH
jgi:hypothetical protein